VFTGIIANIGEIAEITKGEGSRHFKVRSPFLTCDVALGASIAHDGCCLTVTDRDEGWHSVDVSSHTLAHTTLGVWQVGQRINLERALRAGDELGGHLVSGHVDGVATIRAITHEDEVQHYGIEAPEALMRYIADKGSVTLDGTSLTVTWVEDNQFGLTLIPHTLAVTTWGEKRVGDRLNLEVDMLARYVARALPYLSSYKTIL
jgi:riboflavin synthase